jgi:aspartate/methionine/tyrosine aminotransferase
MKTKSAFKEIPDMGVIWVMDEAIKLGFYNGNPDWTNLGQGQPEFGEMEGAPPRVKEIAIEISDNSYGPLNGMHELRESIASHYNRLYRKNKPSQYTADNVSIAMGGRLVLTHICNMLGNIRLGYKVPEYPAYADILNNHKGRIEAIHIPTLEENNFSLPVADFSEAVIKNELDAFLLSNPCNPTGDVIEGEELQQYLRIANENGCTLIIDEFYSHYIFNDTEPGKRPVSIAEFIGDVNEESVLIVDGLTKSFRYPGWRLAWTLGPVDLIDNLNRVASAIDGGPSQPMQRAALKVLEPENADKETAALRKVFSRKKNLMVDALAAIGITCSTGIRGTFYIWGDISLLPAPLNDSEHFFTEALKHKVMTIPGHLFDIHPGHIHGKTSNFRNYVRFSFGPDEKNMLMGLERITTLIKTAKQ